MAITGATSISYTTASSVAADSGSQFRAVFTNIAGSATSSTAKLTVIGTAVPAAGVMSLLAGDIGGYGTIDGIDAAARFGKMDGLALDGAGNLYVADTSNATIRKISAQGVVTTLAGLGGVQGTADGTGVAARFGDPWSLAVDASGNLYVADFDHSLIRKVTPTGTVTTLAGGGTNPGVDGTGSAARFGGPLGLTIDGLGNLFVTDEFNHTIRKITPAGVVTTFAGQTGVAGANDGTGTGARFTAPKSIAIDTGGNLFVGDGNRVVRKITPAGVVTTLAGTVGVGGHADGTGATASFSDPRGLATDAAGNVYVADTDNCLVRKITPAGVVTTLAGVFGVCSSIDGPVASATFNQPQGILVDPAGDLYVSGDFGFVVRKISAAGVVSTIAGDDAHFGDVDAAGTAARFAFGTGFGGTASTGVDAVGNVFVTDFHNGAVRKVSPLGSVSTFVGNLTGPTGLAVDGSGNAYVGDQQAVLKISPAGQVSTLAGSGMQGSADGTGAAASFGTIDALAVDASGNVWVADGINQEIRKVTAAGVVTTVAGIANVSGSTDGIGTAATFSAPNGIAVDAAGNVYVADAGNSTIRKITAAGVVSTLAGTAGQTGSTDGAGAAALFAFPTSIVVDSTANLYVADIRNNNIRKVTPAGMVTTVVGAVNEVGVRLGSNARLAAPSGLSLAGDHTLILVSANAVLSFSLP